MADSTLKEAPETFTTPGLFQVPNSVEKPQDSGPKKDTSKMPEPVLEAKKDEASVVHDTSDLHVQHKGHVYLVNVFTPKPGQTEKFITAQTAEYRRLEGKIPGWLGNRLHRSIDGKKVVNYAEFESLGLYIKWRNSQLFKEHLDRVKDYVARAEPGMYSEPLYDMKSEINIGEEKMNSNKNDAPESPLVTEEIVEGVEQNLVIKNGDKTVRFKEGAASDGTGATEVEVEVTSTST